MTNNTMIGKRRGFTLLECLVYCSLLTMLAVGSMLAIGRARILRGNAKGRAELVLLAQGEIERLRAVPAMQLVEGTRTRRDDSWPATVVSQTTAARRPDGTWSVEVEMQRTVAEGLSRVTLATIRPGGTAS